MTLLPSAPQPRRDPDRLPEPCSPSATGSDPLMEALDELAEAARVNIDDWRGALARIERVKELRATGMAYSDMPPDTETSVIGTVSRNQDRLTQAAAHLRRALARQLVAEGWSQREVADVFGVTPQRINALVSDN